MLHLFSPHYSMGLNITNEMNICAFFHGVSAFREFHSFIVLIYVYVYTIGFFESDCCCHCICIITTILSMCASASNIFFQSHTIFFRGFVTYVVVTVYISYVILAEIRAMSLCNAIECNASPYELINMFYRNYF